MNWGYIIVVLHMHVGCDYRKCVGKEIKLCPVAGFRIDLVDEPSGFLTTAGERWQSVGQQSFVITRKLVSTLLKLQSPSILKRRMISELTNNILLVSYATDTLHIHLRKLLPDTRESTRFVR